MSTFKHRLIILSRMTATIRSVMQSGGGKRFPGQLCARIQSPGAVAESFCRYTNTVEQIHEEIRNRLRGHGNVVASAASAGNQQRQIAARMTVAVTQCAAI